MQETSRDEFPILNGDDSAAQAAKQDICPTLICNVQNTSSLNTTDSNVQKLPKEDGSEVTSVKLEDINTIDLFPLNSSSWQQYQIHDLGNSRLFLDSRRSFQPKNTNLLLQGSDDPLISHGANSVLTNDDEQLADFAKSLIRQTNNQFQNTMQKQENGEKLYNIQDQQQQQPTRSVAKSGCSSLTRQQLKAKASLMSARNQQQQQLLQNQNNAPVPEITTIVPVLNQKTQQRTHKAKSKKPNTLKLRFHHQALPPEYLSHYEATQGQQRSCTSTKTHTNTKTTIPRNLNKPANSFQKPSHSRNSHENVRSWLQKIAEIQKAANASKESNNSARREPVDKQQSVASHAKTKDFQNTLPSVSSDCNNNFKIQKRLEMPKVPHDMDSNPHDVHFMLNLNKNVQSQRVPYSELPYMGEITLDNCKPRRGRKPKKADICHLIYKNYGTILPKKTEPENRLDYSSTRDSLEQPLNLCLRDQANDSYSISSGDELSETNSSCPTPVTTPFDSVRDTMLASTLKKSLSDINEQNVEDQLVNHSHSSEKETYAQPITLCLKKLLDSGLLLHNGHGRYKTIRKDNQLALKIPIPSGSFFPTGKLENLTPKEIILNSDYGESSTTAATNQTEYSTNFNQSQQLLVAPQKRKRSAIFIPPMNVENTNNPATEVSICKFKFTGGSKPSLEEKKMISVDAGGNYRYFSGTGDKASRGFEYFPREVLQHTAGLLPGVNCASHKLCNDIPPPSHGLDHDQLQVPESASSSDLLTERSLNINANSLSATSTATSFESNNNKSITLYGT